MTQEQLLTLTLSKPDPDLLWQLRALLLEAGLPQNDTRIKIVNDFYEFVIKLVASSTARQYSHFASLLDLGAIGGVALQNVLEKSDSENFNQRLLAGALSEVLMVMAARQYVKAWEEELKATYAESAWRLYEGFWHISVTSQPCLDPPERTALVSNLIAPLRDDDIQGTVKAALIVHYYQLLLIAHLKNPTQHQK
jgi:hypothetical protein